jgi:hypothetical protein
MPWTGELRIYDRALPRKHSALLFSEVLSDFAIPSQVPVALFVRLKQDRTRNIIYRSRSNLIISKVVRMNGTRVFGPEFGSLLASRNCHRRQLCIFSGVTELRKVDYRWVTKKMNPYLAVAYFTSTGSSEYSSSSRTMGPESESVPESDAGSSSEGEDSWEGRSFRVVGYSPASIGGLPHLTLATRSG